MKKSFIEYLVEEYLEDSVELIEVFIHKDVPASFSLTMESIWQHSGYKDWMYRVDPADPSIPLQRHIHIARSKHRATKDMQASWNQDGTRHDRSKFNDGVARQRAVRDIARNVLGIEDTISLECYYQDYESFLVESTVSSKPGSIDVIEFSVAD